MSRPSARVSMVPMALASDGCLLLNIAMTDGPDDPRQLVERAMARGSPVFVGVVATGREVTTARARIDDYAAELAGTTLGGRHRRRRPTARRMRKTPS